MRQPRAFARRACDGDKADQIRTLLCRHSQPLVARRPEHCFVPPRAPAMGVVANPKEIMFIFGAGAVMGVKDRLFVNLRVRGDDHLQ